MCEANWICSLFFCIKSCISRVGTLNVVFCGIICSFGYYNPFFPCIPQPNPSTVIIGKITSDPANADDLLGLRVAFQYGDSMLAGAMVNADGEFEVAIAIHEPIDVYYQGIGVAKTFVQTIPPATQDTLWLNWQLPKRYPKRGRRAICPKCNRFDQTIPIRYGLGEDVVKVSVDRMDDTMATPAAKKEHLNGGCLTSGFDPKFYCKRDGVRF